MVLRLVPTDFLTVQAAIDASSPGDSIHILAGKFDGFEVDVENLKIFGCGIGRTIIEGNPGFADNGILVNADRTTLQRFTVQGFEEDGIIVNSSHNVVKEIEMIFNGNDGISTTAIGNNNLIVDCVSSFNSTGFDWEGMHNCVIHCESSSNSFTGFPIFSDNNVLIKNIINNNDIGFGISSTFNTLLNNQIKKNGNLGIFITSNNMTIDNSICDNEGSGVFVINFENVVDSNIVRNNGTDMTDAGILVDSGATDNTIRFNKARNNVEFDIEAEPGAEPPNNTFDGNKCGNSSPPGLCT
ncbi:right-handed parallel beta-helix repeat-containing protein [Bacillus spongiae]|uniref:Right-handed parallel beta-helix repeat-containing protein n=1 Tax=Bacillus spongiae TaxID=2683610 RepID=A0ABU8H8M1_9BACI